MSDQYRFTIVGDQITQIEEYEKGIWKLESIDDNEAWTLSVVDGKQVVTRTETEQKQGDGGALVTVVETTILRDDNGDGIFLEVSETKTVNGVAVVDDSHGGRSRDRYEGRDGDDRYFAGNGNDVLTGGTGSDRSQTSTAPVPGARNS